MNSRRRVNSTVGLLMIYCKSANVLTFTVQTNIRGLMRLNTRKAFLAILMLAIVIVAILSLRAFRRMSNPPIHNQNQTSEYRPANPSPPQRAGAAGKAVTKDGTPASFTSFSTSGGNWFTQWSEFHNSARSARRAMDVALKHANQIIRREPLFDDGGHQIGEKAVATFSGKYAYYGDASLLWTDGSTFRYVAGSSLQNILDYDKGSAP
jgi:hypothetical protein